MTTPPIYNATGGQRRQKGDRAPTEITPFFGDNGRSIGYLLPVGLSLVVLYCNSMIGYLTLYLLC